jgi:bleomycin hydrolase
MRALTIITLLLISSSLFSQEDKAIFKSFEPGFYHNFILKDVQTVNESVNSEPTEKIFLMDQSKMSLPNQPSKYKRMWSQPSLSQGNAGTCWAFGGISFFESEIKRKQGIEIKLSEIFIVYWEYVEKSREFIRTHGKSHFSQGSQANAVTRMIKMHGIVPSSVYSGLLAPRKYHSHDEMFDEMKTYLSYVEKNAIWDENQVVETIKSIMNHHLGTPPESFIYDGKNYTPASFRDEYIKLNPDEYVDVISTMAFDYKKKGLYDVPDNWWKCGEYYNLSLSKYMETLNKALESGYTVAIGGDVSEAGFSRETNVALIPDFDIEAKNINETARQFRFSNHSTTDDHIMHIVGYTKQKGATWYLVKDSSSGSRNVNTESDAFGYYFFHEDYVRLKVLTFTVHQDMIDLL